MPNVSVIIPVYNVEKYLSSCLDSVLNQTYQDFEIICVNDGSTDGSGKILSQYASKDSRIKVLTQTNRGQSVARNKGLDIAKGKYVHFLDSDDFIHPQTFEATVLWAEKYNLDLTNFQFTPEEKPGDLSLDHKEYYDLNTIPYILTYKPYKYTTDIKKSLSGMVTTTLFKRKIFDNLRFRAGIYFEDTLLITQILRDDPKTLITPIEFYKYRKNPKSTVNSIFSEKHMKSYHIILKGIRDYYSAPQYAIKRDFMIKNRIGPICSMGVDEVLKTTADNKKKILPLMNKIINDMDKTHSLPKTGPFSKKMLLARLSESQASKAMRGFQGFCIVLRKLQDCPPVTTNSSCLLTPKIVHNHLTQGSRSSNPNYLFNWQKGGLSYSK